MPYKIYEGRPVENNELNQNSITPSHSSTSSIDDGLYISQQNAILAQNLDKAERKFQQVSERKFKLRWILAISCLPLFGIYAAFGIAPQTLTGTVTTTAMTEEIGIPALEEQAPITSDHFWYKEHVRRDDTLSSVLGRLNIRNRDALDYISNNSVASEIAANLKPRLMLMATYLRLNTSLIMINSLQSSKQIAAMKQINFLTNWLNARF